MTAELAHWESRLAKHFAELHSTRSGSLGAPLFALEHGLEPPEIQALIIAAQAHIAKSPPSAEHSLVWIVYSSEFGYRFSGDEYWQTFEQETPGWTVRGDRYAIRQFYQEFQQKFGGATPSGAWAEHFSIICWPITHAVLPRDLQRQLARTLYELRHSFSAEVFESPVVLGELISARAWTGTSRFQNFAQETQLVGQIAAALLLQGELGTGRLIHPATLKRITADLDRERRSREWLRGARRFATERATIRSLSSAHGKARATTGRIEDARLDVAALGIEPRLVLRPADPLTSAWSVTLEIPDLSHLLLRFPKAREILTGSRCVVAGSSGRPLARGRCLNGAQQVTLARWPNKDEVLLKFDQADHHLEFLLRTECLMRPGPTWLFRIASDGLAYEQRSLRVRAGERYIVLSTDWHFQRDEHIVPLEIKCEGINGALLEIPIAITPAWETTLRQLGLGLGKTIEVWPAGLAAIAWDGEGRGEWLASERPCLAIQTDHPVAGVLVSVGSEPAQSIELSPIVPGNPMFVELPQLGVGLHNVQLSTRRDITSADQPLGELNVVIRVTENRPWSPGVSSHGPLIAQIDPPNPTLEQLWDGYIDVALNGPPGRQVKSSVSLFERDDESHIFRELLPAIALPVTPNRWRQHFDRFCRHARNAQAAYDKARICEIEFRAEELGALTLRCEREFTPLRWLIRREGRDHIVQPLNDTDSSTHPLVEYSTFENPAVPAALDSSATYRVPSAGGLYVAQLPAYRAAIIAPPTLTGLQDLVCTPLIAVQPRSTGSVLRALATARNWGNARLPGDPVSAKRQRDVLDAFARHIVQIIGGDGWIRAEMGARKGNGAMGGLVNAVSRRREEAALGVIINRDCAELATLECKDRIARLTSLVARYLSLPLRSVTNSVLVETNGHGGQDIGPNSLDWICELALRLTSCPSSVEQWAGELLSGGVTRLVEELATVVRAARLLVLSTDNYLQQHIDPAEIDMGEIYAGWRWQ